MAAYVISRNLHSGKSILFVSLYPCYLCIICVIFHQQQPETEGSSDYKEKEKSEGEDMPPKKSMTKTPAKLSTPESSPNASPKPVEKVYTKNARNQSRQKEREKEMEKLKKVKEKEKQKEERKEKEKEKGSKVIEKKGKETTLPKLGPGRPKKSDVTLGKSDGVSSKSTISAAEDKGKCRITFDQLLNTCCLLRLLPVSFLPSMSFSHNASE